MEDIDKSKEFIDNMLVGFYPVIIDGSKRICVPAEYKRIMSAKSINEIVMVHFPHYSSHIEKPVVSCYLPNDYSRIVENMKGTKYLDIYLRGIKARMDSSGRINLGSMLCNLLSIEESDKLKGLGMVTCNAVISGHIDHFNIWKAKDYDDYSSRFESIE